MLLYITFSNALADRTVDVSVHKLVVRSRAPLMSPINPDRHWPGRPQCTGGWADYVQIMAHYPPPLPPPPPQPHPRLHV